MAQKSISIEEIAKFPYPGFAAAPGSFAFSPDDAILTYLYSPSGTLSRQLYAMDPKSGKQELFAGAETGTTEENVSREEALRRERQRQLATGITHYQWARKGRRVLLSFPDGLYVQEGPGQPRQKIFAVQDHPALDPHFSPDGEWVAYVQEGEVWVVSAAGGEPRQLTFGGRDRGVTNGLAEYAAQEEMGRFQGFWWSEDSQWLAFEEVDESHIPLYRIAHQGKDFTGAEALEEHRYPFAGQANARFRLGVVPVGGGEPVWMQTEGYEYLARVQWLPDGNLSAQLENRAQTQLDLVVFSSRSGRGSLLLSEKNEVWINLHDLFRPLPAKQAHYPNGFIWGSERSGFQHLYLYAQDGSLVRALTAGEWMVERVIAVDARREVVYFTGRKDSPLESHLYSVSFQGGPVRRLTRQAGLHTVFMDHGFHYFVDIHDALDLPPHVSLRRLADGKLVRELFANQDPRLDKLDLRPPKLVSFKNRDGVLLYGALYSPAKKKRKPLPTIVFVYGGPHTQMVVNGWQMSCAMRVQYLRSLGYVVFILDNRGSARRGLAFEGALKHHMGSVEVRDQVDGIRWLVIQGITDPQRVGIYGWSYGGYMAAMCLCKAPETFQAAVAGAPVTDWDGYDTHYTERYMGTPQSNPEGYAESSVMRHVDGLQGKLMLVHGLIDENVHFRHTARLINALIQARKKYELLLFPDERHSPRKPADRVFMEEQIRDFLLKNLPLHSGRSKRAD